MIDKKAIVSHHLALMENDRIEIVEKRSFPFDEPSTYEIALNTGFDPNFVEQFQSFATYPVFQQQS